MVVNDRPLKRMTRRVTADLPDFFTFSGHGGGGPFRSTVQCFLKRHARQTLTPSLLSPLMTWQILFRIGGDGDVVALDIVEEDVTRSRSSIYCDQCRVVGWSGHPVCRKRYHFIIRNNCQSKEGEEDQRAGGYYKPCTICGNLLHLLDSSCNSCNSVITTDDVLDWVYLQLEGASHHLLHGVVHSNGYGHLLRLNGREGGSDILSGGDIMNFWDKLCKTLAVRKVSVMDVSKKYGMEYRLLHAIANGRPWYGNWGYEFRAGSYALTQDDYQKAVETLAKTPLSLFSFKGHRPRTRLQAVIRFYQSISDCKVVSLKDLFSFILRLIHKSHRSTKNETCKKAKCTTNMIWAWTRRDEGRVEQAIIKVLQAAAAAAAGDTNGSCWVSRRALIGALCKTTSPELLDYCLKRLGGKRANNGRVVNTRFNPSSAAFELRLEPLGFVHNQAGSNSNHPSEEHLIHDLKFLYDSILHPQLMLSYRPPAKTQLVIDSATKLLDCKQFVKDYKPHKMAPAATTSAICVWCHVVVVDHPKDDPPTPPELLILPENASVADLKVEATKAFQEVYALYQKFEANELLEYGPLDDSLTLKLLVGSTRSVRVRGRCLGTYGLNHFRRERGTENWIVDCTCGAKDDDGERMLACDKCGIWQHTRCAGIDNFDAIPEQFICTRCLNSNKEISDKVAKSDEEAKKFVLSSRTCRGEAPATNTSEQESSMTKTFGVPLI